MNENLKSQKIEIVYASNESNYKILEIEAMDNLSIEEAIKLSGMLALYPEIDLAKNKVGVFGKAKQLNDLVQGGDRIEIYRPLLIDPKEARRKRERDRLLKRK